MIAFVNGEDGIELADFMAAGFGEVPLADHDFLGLLYLREDREETEAGIPDNGPFLAERVMDGTCSLGATIFCFR